MTANHSDDATTSGMIPPDLLRSLIAEVITPLVLKRLGPVIDEIAAVARARLHMELTAPLFLTPREREVLKLVAAGMTNREIGQNLYISPRTVQCHVERILDKLGVATRVEAARFALIHGLA